HPAIKEALIRPIFHLAFSGSALCSVTTIAQYRTPSLRGIGKSLELAHGLSFHSVSRKPGAFTLYRGQGKTVWDTFLKGPLLPLIQQCRRRRTRPFPSVWI